VARVLFGKWGRGRVQAGRGELRSSWVGLGFGFFKGGKSGGSRAGIPFLVLLLVSGVYDVGGG